MKKVIKHFSEPCHDLELWETTQRRIAIEFKTDNAVVDFSRVMRLPGTVSYPSVAKQAKGYIPELVTMKLRKHSINYPTVINLVRVFLTTL